MPEVMKGLKDMTDLELDKEQFNRRAAFQRALAELRHRDPAKAQVVRENFEGDANVILEGKATRTVFVPNVFTLWEQDTGTTGLRTAQPTLDEAKRVLDLERSRAGQPPLKWQRERGGARANALPLVYEVVPLEVYR